MERSCYRCGTQVEEHTPFCPSCGAPQIRVTAPSVEPPNLPSTPPLPPGTPDSIPPATLPVQLAPAGQIEWRKFLRFALPLAVVSGVAIALSGLGIILFLASIVVAVRRYRRDHSGPLMATQGMRLGAAFGLISYVVALIIPAVYYAQHFAEFQQLMLTIQQQAAGNPDPRIQQLAHWVVTSQGMLVLVTFGMVVFLVFVLLISAIAGALAAGFSGGKRG